jgi:hypothetical protein
MNCRLRGMVVRWALENGFPWGVIKVSAEECELVSGLGRRFHVPRQSTGSVEFTRLRLYPILMFRTLVYFISPQGERLAPAFIPWRSRKLRDCLISANWPVLDRESGSEAES